MEIALVASNWAEQPETNTEIDAENGFNAKNGIVAWEQILDSDISWALLESGVQMATQEVLLY